MLSVVEIIFIIFIGGLLWVFVKFNSRKDSDLPSPDLIMLPYKKAETLLNDTEQKFYHALKGVVGEQYAVFAKVRLSDFIDVKSGMSKADTKAFTDKLHAHCIDFLLCEPQNTNIIVAIELEDIAISESDRSERESFVNKVFKDSKALLLRFQVRSIYSDEILKQLKENIRFSEESDEV